MYLYISYHHHQHHQYHQHIHHNQRYHRMTLAPVSWADNVVIVRATTTLTTPTDALSARFPDTTSINNNYNNNNNMYNDGRSIIMSSTVSENHEGEDTDTVNRFFTVWGIATVLVALSVVTLVSNGAILTMFVLRKSLRRCKNIYIASLAAADLAIGITLPVAALEQVESRWVLEGTPCHLFQTVRSSLLYVSLLSILLITLDRCWSIHCPFTYRVRQSKRLAAVAVFVVWLIGFGLHVPPTLVWDYVIDRRDAGTSDVKDTADSVVSYVTHASLVSSSSSSVSPSRLLSMLTTIMPAMMSAEGAGQELPSAAMAAGEEEETSETWIGVRPVDTFRHRQVGGAAADVLTVSGATTAATTTTATTVTAAFIAADRIRCELPYNLHFTFVLTVSLVLYFFPLLALWVLNCSLYLKITRRKSIKIRRSLSVNDNYLLTFRKSSSESESSPNNGADSDSAEIRSAEQRQRLLAAARAGRRHTLAFPGHHTRLGGAGSVYYPSQNMTRANQARRVSLQDAFTGIGSMAALAGAIPNLPRVTSYGRFSGSGVLGASSSLVPMGLWYGSGPRHSVCSSRKQSDDLVKELLVRQDKRAARLLGLLVTVFTLCWLPHSVVAVLRASDQRAVSGWLLDLVSWVLVTNSAINPFLYGLLNAEFRKILRGWFYFRRRGNYRLKHALLYWSLPPNADSDGLKDAPVSHGLFATPIKE